jgi:MFS family permease
MAAFTSIFRNRNLMILGFSWTVSRMGSWVTMMAVLAMIVFRGDGGVMESSGIFLAGLLPVLVFSPLAGKLCDRYNRKWLMIASELLSGLAVLGMVFIDQIWLIYILLAVQSTAGTIMEPARQAVMPEIVSKTDLTHANAFMVQVNGAIKILAPVMAGALMVVMAPQTAILLDVVSYILSAIILTRMPNLLPPSVVDRDLDTGLVAVQNEPGVLVTLKDKPHLQLLFLSIFVAIFIIIGFDVLSVIFVRDVIQGNENIYGILVGMIGLGTLGGAVILMLRKKHVDPWRDILIGMALISLIPLGPALAELVSRNIGIGLMLICNLLGGLGLGLLSTQVNTLLQVLPPPAVLGRIAGAFESTAVAGQLAGMLVTPLLVPGLISMGQYFFFSALGIILLTAVMTIILRKMLTTPQYARSASV